MALRPGIGHKNPAAVRHGKPVPSPQKVRCIRAFTEWAEQLGAGNMAELSSLATKHGVRERTIWRHLRADPKLAEKVMSGLEAAAVKGLHLGIMRGLAVLTEGKAGEENGPAWSEYRFWAEFFAKYAHGGFKAKEGGGSTNVFQVNIGLPAHVRRQLGIDDSDVKKIDVVVKDELGDLVDMGGGDGE